MEIVDKIREITGNILQDKAIELIELKYRRESGGMVLRLLVDKEGGITMDECTSLNNEIGSILDEKDIMQDKYTLEVSSPGLDRPLKTRRDFERVTGKMIYLHTYGPVNDKRDHEGVVISVDDEKVTVNNVDIRLDKIAKAKLKIEI